MGTYIETEKEKVFFKTVPVEENKEVITKFIDFEDYKEKYTDINTKLLTQAQRERFLLRSPDKDILISNFGY